MKLEALAGVCRPCQSVTTAGCVTNVVSLCNAEVKCGVLSFPRGCCMEHPIHCCSLLFLVIEKTNGRVVCLCVDYGFMT